MRSDRCPLFLLIVSFLLATLALTGSVFAETRERRDALAEQIEQLDQDLRSQLERAGERARAGKPAEMNAAEDAKLLRQRLESLERLAAARDGELGERYLAKVRHLGDLVTNLERAAKIGPTTNLIPPGDGRVGRRDDGVLRNGLAPTNDNCADALLISPGTVLGSTLEATQDGVAVCGASSETADVWYRFIATTSGTFFADTFGSSYDTVVSVHLGCPGTPENQVTCNDDAFGLQSSASFFASSGTTYWIRISGFDGATGDFDLTLDTGGAVLGEVTRNADGSPRSSHRVEAWDEDGFFLNSTNTNSSGSYFLGNLPPETAVFLATDEDSSVVVDELWNDIQCPNGPPGGCDVTTGDPLILANGELRENIDFGLADGGRITGQVTELGSGLPVDNVRVEIYNADGTLVRTAFTNAAGNYEATGLADGDHYAVAEPSQHADQLYDGLPCQGGAPSNCDVVGDGTPIPVLVDTTISGIDFAVEPFRSLSGTVTDTGGVPIDGVFVQVWRDIGSYSTYSSAVTAADGTYSVGGLEPATYTVSAQVSNFLDELWDDIPCPDGVGNYDGCEPEIGNPIVMTFDADATGIDFALTPLGSISGTVTSEASGNPLTFTRVEVWDAAGDFVSADDTNSSGNYLVGGLVPGTYFVRTDEGSVVNELFDNLPCQPDCTETSGTPVVVGLDEDVLGIDFALQLPGAISGSVTQVGGASVSGSVILWSSSGSQLSSHTLSSGTYTISNIQPGDYFVTTSTSLLDELWDDLPCEGGCDIQSGTPITVVLDTTTPNIDFVLQPKGSISGTVTDAMGGGALSSVRMELYDDRGFFFGSSNTDGSGSYRFTGLSTGTYFLRTDEFGFSDVLYDGLSCEPGCTITDGTEIAVTVGVETNGIDFVLQRLASISGEVRDASDGNLINADVFLYDSEGRSVDSDFPYSGQYSFSGLLAGTYFIIAEGDNNTHAPEIWDDLLCPIDCDPTTGTPIVLSAGADLTGFDFDLERTGRISGTVVDAADGSPIDDRRVEVWSSENVLVTSANTNSSGNYTATGLVPGTYYVSTDRRFYGPEDRLDMLWNGVSCLGGAPEGCTPSKGSPIHLGLSEDRRGVSFVLRALNPETDDPSQEGRIIGSVVAAADGQPRTGITLDIWDDLGTLVASAVTLAEGKWSVVLDPGTYFVSTEAGPILRNEVWEGVDCNTGSAFDGACDPTTGTALVVTAGADIPGVDFVLEGFPIFVDGFESGDATSWTVAVGLP